MARTIILAVDVETPADQIFEALTTRDGLASFWTPKVDGEAGSGGRLRFGFEAAPVDLEIEVRSTDVGGRSVTWDCHGPWPFWVGTEIQWTMVGENPTRVLFTHGGWSEEQPTVEFGAVAYTWAVVLQALKAFSESGVVAPALS